MLDTLRQRFPGLTFVAGDKYYWSPRNNEISYDQSRSGDEATWSLLHETGHALLDHNEYQDDFELLQLEMAAWRRARELATELGASIDEDHIQDCLDTYRDWLYKRSVCPRCSTKALQQDDHIHYRCFNCHKVWRVAPSRFCRAYRSSKHLDSPAHTEPSAVFNTSTTKKNS